MNQDGDSKTDFSPPERLPLVNDLWGDLPATPADILIPDWQLEDLDRRKANLMNNPAAGLDWEEVKQSIRRNHGR